MVLDPQANGPAAKAGIESGDVITSVNGEVVKDPRDLARTIGSRAPGANVKLNVLHKGRDETVILTLGPLPATQEANADSAHGSDIPRLGLTDAPASSVAGAGKIGVLVTDVDPKSAAADRGVKEGDVILEVAGSASGSLAASGGGLQGDKNALRAVRPTMSKPSNGISSRGSFVSDAGIAARASS